jgi:hypothetical protein
LKTKTHPQPLQKGFKRGARSAYLDVAIFQILADFLLLGINSPLEIEDSTDPK